MEQMIAYCGLDCAKCDAFIATKNNDNQKRIETAKNWSKEYNAEIKPEHINCDGCMSKSNKLFNHCLVCEIRKCAITKNIENCKVCDEYRCTKITSMFG